MNESLPIFQLSQEPMKSFCGEMRAGFHELLHESFSSSLSYSSYRSSPFCSSRPSFPSSFISNSNLFKSIDEQPNNLLTMRSSAERSSDLTRPRDIIPMSPKSHSTAVRNRSVRKCAASAQRCHSPPISNQGTPRVSSAERCPFSDRRCSSGLLVKSTTTVSVGGCCRLWLANSGVSNQKRGSHNDDFGLSEKKNKADCRGQASTEQSTPTGGRGSYFSCTDETSSCLLNRGLWVPLKAAKGCCLTVQPSPNANSGEQSTAVDNLSLIKRPFGEGSGVSSSFVACPEAAKKSSLALVRTEVEVGVEAEAEVEGAMAEGVLESSSDLVARAAAERASVSYSFDEEDNTDNRAAASLKCPTIEGKRISHTTSVSSFRSQEGTPQVTSAVAREYARGAMLQTSINSAVLECMPERETAERRRLDELRERRKNAKPPTEGTNGPRPLVPPQVFDSDAMRKCPHFQDALERIVAYNTARTKPAMPYAMLGEDLLAAVVSRRERFGSSNSPFSANPRATLNDGRVRVEGARSCVDTVEPASPSTDPKCDGGDSGGPPSTIGFGEGLYGGDGSLDVLAALVAQFRANAVV